MTGAAGPKNVAVKTTLNPVKPSSLLAGSRAIRLGLWSALAALPTGASLAEPPAAPAEPKTHVLYMGADVDVLVKGLYCRVKSVSDASFIVRRKGEDVRVSVERGPVELRVKQTLKLTQASATIDKLAVDRAYTPANDPYRKFAREQPGGGAGAAAALAQGRSNAASIAASGTGAINRQLVASGMLPSGSGAAAAAEATMAASAAAADISANNAFLAQDSNANNVGAFVSRLQDELAKELFDAVEIAFLVSSEKPLSDAYVVISAACQPPEAKPGTTQLWVYARSLGAVGPRPQKVRIKQGGFPPGFKLERVQIYLFSQGEELATNVSSKRVDLTFDEAFQYVCLDYLSSHKGASVPAAPIMGRLPPGWRQRLAAEQAARPLFIKVSREGRPLGAFTDDACTQSVTDAYLASLIGEIRFTPALEQGRAVAGIARLRFADIQM